MMTVDVDLFESVGYVAPARRLYVKFRNAPSMYYEGVPNFRYQGLLSAPRKDAYFRTYIQNHFLAKEVPPAGS